MAPKYDFSKKWATPLHWTSYYNGIILPPPRALVTYTKAKQVIENVGGTTDIPIGAYECNINPTVSANPTDAQKAQMQAFLKRYWTTLYDKEVASHDDVWLFSYTVAEQPKINSGLGKYPVPDPGKAEPGLHLPNPLSAAESVAHFLEELAAFIFNPVRMGELVIGTLLIVVGANAVLKNPAGGAAKAVTSVVPVGKVAKVARAPQLAAKETQRAASRAYATSYAKEAGRRAAGGGR